MEAQVRKKARNRKIEPLNWREAAQAPALKGMMSFLEISPEEIRRGHHYPDTAPSLHIVTPPMDILSPVDGASPIDTMSTDDAVSPVDRMSLVDAPYPVDVLSTVDTMSSMDTVSPVDGSSPGQSVYTSPKRTQGMVVGEVPTRNRKIFRCRLAQDGHTPAEESLYKTLWDDTKAEDRTVRMGYAELSARTRLSRKTVGRLLQSLKAKLSIETLDEHRSGDLVPKTYRVYSYREILDRRREAGMEFVIRLNGVIFVTPAGVPILPLGEGKGREGNVPPPVDRMSTGDSTSLGDIKTISEALNRFWAVDEAAAVQLLRSCRSVRPDATAGEIAFFVGEKVYLVRTNRTITNPTGFVLATVPPCFAGQTFESFRARRNESLRIAAEEEQRKGRELQELEAWLQQSGDKRKVRSSAL